MTGVCRQANAAVLALSETKDGAKEAVDNLRIAASSSAFEAQGSVCEVATPLHPLNPKDVFHNLCETVTKTTELMTEQARLCCSLPGCDRGAVFRTSRVARSVPISGPRTGEVQRIVPSLHRGTDVNKMVCDHHAMSTLDPPAGAMGVWFHVPNQPRATAEYTYKCKFTFAALAAKGIQALEEGGGDAAGPMRIQCRNYDLEAFLKMSSMTATRCSVSSTLTR